MIQVKTSELTGVALDWAVAKCEGILKDATQASNFLELCKQRSGVALTHGRTYTPSTDWTQGGPIIDRIEGLQFKHWLEAKPEACCEAHIHNYHGDWFAIGSTLLIAAMRCYVASKLGDMIEVPDELIK